MTAKKISELDAKTPINVDIIPVANSSTGIAGKSTCNQVFTAGANQLQIVTFPGTFGYGSANLPISSSVINNQIIGNVTIYKMIPSVNCDITGLAPIPPLTTHADGRLLWILNVGPSNLSLKNEDSRSTASNRFLTHNGSHINMGVGHLVLAMYDGSQSQRWRIWDLT